MKRILFLILVLFVAGACLDDKSNYDYRDINNYDDNKWKITGIGGEYSLFPGESITLTPVVRLSMDTLNPDVEGHWLLDGIEVATGPSYTFEATEYGEYNLVYLATDKKTGVSFPAEADIQVAPPYKFGWLFLSRTASGNSHLSLLAGKKTVLNPDDYATRRDSLIYVDFYTNLGETLLGTGPIKLIEEFAFPGENLTLPSEVMILQESGPIELGGYELDFTGSPLNEFVGEKPNLKIKNAVLGWSSKWLQTDDNQLYFSVSKVLTDLHSGRYSDDPAFNGAKYETLVEGQTAGDSYSVSDVILAIDETNTMWALVNDGSEKSYGDGLMDPRNKIGARARLKNNSSGSFDMTLFNNFTGRYVKHLLVHSNKYFLSLLERDGKYLWHKYLIEVDRSYTVGSEIAVTSSKTGVLAAEMFTDFKDAAFVKGRNTAYEDTEWLFVASGNKLYGTVMKWDEGLVSKDFVTAREDIVSIKARYFYNSLANDSSNKYIHLGVLLVDGTFLVLEVNYDANSATFTTKTIFDKNLKQLDPNIVEVVDMIHKYGAGTNTDGYLN